jgi:hypothetical protein
MNFMLQNRSRRFALYALTIVAGMAVSCVILALIGYNINQKLPTGPDVTDRMDPLDKARLAEALHLKAELGDAIWPAYAELDAPVIIWNDDYEFLFGIGAPPTDWELVVGDDFEGNVYFRRPADDPQNFAVPVGDEFAASVFTKYMLDVSLINAIRDLLPTGISEIFPYRIFIQPSELQIAGVQHEYFHVLQAYHTPEKFNQAEDVYAFDDQYWALDGDMRSAWVTEIEFLINAVEATNAGDAAEYSRQFLAQRDQRRQEFGLDGNLSSYEVWIEWLEGTAKYVELRSWEAANDNPDYLPLSVIADDADFKNYKDFDGQWNQALRQTRQQAGEEGDVRFYYTGMLQAYLLDRLMPGWKTRIGEDDATLESLLRQALKQ